jgi:capsular polysaccharide biosynthesis protein
MSPALAARLSRFLVGCYPRRWRQRYAEEMLEVLGQHRPTARTVLNLAAGAVSAHLDPAWRARRPGLRRGARAAAIDDRSADFARGLVSPGFITAALRRSAWFWCVMAVAGLLAGFGVYVTSPHEYQASTSLVLTLGPYENVNTAAGDDQAMAESRAVTGLAVHELGLRQSAGSFLGTYTVTALTERVLLITVSAPSSNQAVHWANAVATAFLKFRAGELRAQPNLEIQALDQRINQTRQNISSISAQISRLSVQPASPAQQSQLGRLQAESSQATTTLTNLQQALIGTQTNIQPATTAAVKGSFVLNLAVPLPHSRLKPLLLYAGSGLVLGLALGVGIVVVRARVRPATLA